MSAEFPELTAVADSIALNGPTAGTPDLAQRALDFYDRRYSDYPPAVLASEVARCRRLLLDHQDADSRRVLGWLSAMLGNLAHHSGDPAGALIHLGTASRIGADVGDRHLAGWALGAQSMVATGQERHAEALELTGQAESHADTALRRAQSVAWCRLRPLAAVGDANGLTRAVASARRHMEAAEEAPGRFGFDRAEFELHLAEALVGEDPVAATRHAEVSAGLKRVGSPGWAAATSVLARCHAARHGVDDACALAGGVLDAVPPVRMRATTRSRLQTLVSADLGQQRSPRVRELKERVRALN
ncbi:hypothetical protein ACFQZ2_01945 [Streptomonospora algeriensis]|uniref:XRE family transcriptional regulator n=1 Tax=Streptomonospora algeriensis TaxID=995084 RepID=A0ABW3BEA4_9ACTN